MRSRFYKDLSSNTLKVGYDSMAEELRVLPSGHTIRRLFDLAWLSFIENKWSYDGASFVRERSNKTVFEVAAFIHDWRNSMGWVSSEVDQELLSVMIALQYSPRLIAWRFFWLKLSLLNRLRHRLLGDLNLEPVESLYRLPCYSKK